MALSINARSSVSYFPLSKLSHPSMVNACTDDQESLPDKQDVLRFSTLLLLFRMSPKLWVHYPTDPSTILGPRHPSMDVSKIHKIHRSPDLEALEFVKGRSGRMSS